MPEVKTGSTKTAATRPERQPSKALAAWRKAQKDHATKPPRSGTALFAAAQDTGILSLVPEGQADAPWHRITDLAITDAPTARTDYSTGNPMLTGTDFDIAGVCRRLTLTRTYNSPDAPRGKVSQRWWQQYERHLSLGSSEVILYDNSGATVRFTKNSDGSLTTPKRYSQELRNNIDSARFGRVPGGMPGTLPEFVALQHHRVPATPAESDEAMFCCFQQGTANALAAHTWVHSEAVEVTAPTVRARDDRAYHPAGALRDDNRLGVTGDEAADTSLVVTNARFLGGGLPEVQQCGDVVGGS
ncbi:hypothetical protein P3T26_002724 [Streptomyces sp. MAA16]|nr:hypothetical protein [Streptomyces sp. MAA16]